MQVTMFDTLPFVSFIDMIMDESKTVELIFTQQELKISLLNNSHVCFYEAVFKKDFFDYYKINDVESIMVDTADLHKILKTASKDEMEMESDGSHLILKLESDNGNRRIFELPLIDEEHTSSPPPEIDYNLDFQVDISKLNQCVFDLDKVVGTDRFKLVVNEDGVCVTTPEDVMTNYKCILDESITGSSGVSVNTAYIGKLSRLKKMNKTVELKIGDNYPLSWNMSSVMDDVVVKGLIAPIIEENE